MLMLISSCLISGCIIREEGCLDPNAVNYNLSADRACKGCCNFPNLLISWTPKWNGENFSTQDTFYDADGMPYKIPDIRILAQGWTWYDENQSEFKVENRNWACGDDSIRVNPDFLEIIPGIFTYRTGTIKQFPQIESVRFTLGSETDFSCLDTLDSTTPRLLTPYGNFWNPQDESLASIRLVIDPDLDGLENDTLYFPSQVSIQIPYTFVAHRGQAIQFRITVDYGQWFSNARLQDYTTFQASFLSGLSGSIIQTP